MDQLSKRQIILIEKYIADNNFSLDALDKAIAKCGIEKRRLEKDIVNIREAEESKIACLTTISQLKLGTKLQKTVYEKYNPADVQIDAYLFEDVIRELIMNIDEDIKGLECIKYIFTRKYKKSLSNPSSPRSMLETS